MTTHAPGHGSLVGLKLSHYRVGKKLGGGGMGIVYEAEDNRLRRKVALKFLPDSFAEDLQVVLRFQREARAASALNHPNICTIYDIDEVNGQHFIAMELLEGQTLRERMAAKKLSIRETVDLAIQITDGLDAAHAKGIVHRDIKPANLFITQHGQAKILDFGLAKMAFDKCFPVDSVAVTVVEEETLTFAGTTIGTVAYMSPEQVLGVELDARTDLFSLGVVLYEMTTGLKPFQGGSTAAIFDRILHENPSLPSRVNPEVPAALEHIINKCLEKDRSRRFGCPAQLLSALRALRERQNSAAVRVPESATRAEVPSIAVLPFANLSQDPANDYFGDGLAEELINALTQIQDLRVVARTSAFYFKGKDTDVREIGKRLNVQKVLEGSVRTAGKQVRVTAQLINVGDGYHIWSERFDRNIENIFAIQDEITLAIVDKLKVKLLEQEKEKLVKRRTEDREAYQLYLQGRYHLNKRTETDLIKSLELFQQALAKDRQFAAAHAGLADAYVALGWHNYRPGEFLTDNKQRALCRRIFDCLYCATVEPASKSGTRKQVGKPKRFLIVPTSDGNRIFR